MTNDKDELKSRVEQLEQTVQQQQNTIKKMLPNRRQALKGLGVLGAGGILGASANSASASTGSAGQIGTSTDRPDIFGDSVDANSVNTANAPTGDNDVLRWQEGVASGLLSSSTTLGGASSDGFDDNNSKNLSVSFNSAFDSTPVVVANINPSGTDNAPALRAQPFNISSSGFDVAIRNYGTVVSGFQEVVWIATEGRE